MHRMLPVFITIVAAILACQVGCSQQSSDAEINHKTESTQTDASGTSAKSREAGQSQGYAPRTQFEQFTPPKMEGSQAASAGEELKTESPSGNPVVYVPCRMIVTQDEDTSSRKVQTLTNKEIYLSVGVLVFTTSVLVMVVFLRWKSSITGDVFFRSFGLVVIVGSSLFLISAGWSQSQITPVIGLLGTGIGFIFGKDSEPKQPADGKSK